jgi:tetratricopeptide (TPR) repeat protein
MIRARMAGMTLVLTIVLARAAVAAPGLTWLDDPAPQAMPVAVADRPVLMYFTAPWCVPCKLLAREVFDHPAGRAELDHYTLVRLDLEHDHGRVMADSLRVGTVPTFVMMGPEGEIDRVRGYRSRRLLLRDLRRFRAGDGTMGDLERRLRASPGDPVLQAALGLRRYERLDLAGAEAMLSAGLRDPASLPDTLAADAGRALAELYRREDDPAAAAAVLERLLDRRPTHTYPRVTWQMLADCRAATGDDTARLGALREAAFTEPVRVDPLVDFAREAATGADLLADAERAGRLAVAMTDRADADAMAVLASVLRRRREYPEAMLWIKRAVAAAPDDAALRRQREEIIDAAIRGD